MSGVITSTFDLAPPSPEQFQELVSGLTDEELQRPLQPRPLLQMACCGAWSPPGTSWREVRASTSASNLASPQCTC